jgi:predicted dehydrogenase
MSVLRFAGIGVGGKGSSDIDQAATLGDVVAVCDCDDNPLNEKLKKWPSAKKFYDFREMFDKMGKEIDAVTISTPDHTHAIAAAHAIVRKMHVYVQKPLTHDVWEARYLRTLARKYKVATQMGNQGSAANGLRRGVEAIQAGVIGKVTEVHVWTNRPVWPQSPAIKARPTEVMPIPGQRALGASSSGPRRCARTTRRITRSTGAVGGITAPAPSATWPAIPRTSRSARSTSPSQPWSRRRTSR